MKNARRITATLMVGVLLLLWRGPDDEQINLKTGDLRYRMFRIPISYRRLRPPYSDWLEKISSGTDRWVTVATFPRPTSKTGPLFQGFYADAATWVTVDRTIAKSVRDDVEHYIISTEARYGLPKACVLLNLVQYGEKGQHPKIKEGWQSARGVPEYLEMRHLRP